MPLLDPNAGNFVDQNGYNSPGTAPASSGSLGNINFDSIIPPQTPSASDIKRQGTESAGAEKRSNLGVKLNNMPSDDMQQLLSDKIDNQVYDDGDGKLYQMNQYIDWAGRTQFKKVPYDNINKWGNADTRNLYIDNNKNGDLKLGLARTDQGGFDGRYDPALHPDWQRASNGLLAGPKGVTPNDGALMDIMLPSQEATDFERTVHSNVGQIKNRAAGVTNSEIAAARPSYGSGVSEYTTQNAPLWNQDYKDDGKLLPADTYLPSSLDAGVDSSSLFDGKNSTSYANNLVKALSSGAITTAAGIGDAILTGSANVAYEVAQAVGIGDKFTAEERDFSEKILDRFKSAKYVDSEITGYDRSIQEKQIADSLANFKKGNIAEGVWDGLKAGPEVFIGSLPYMAAAMSGIGMVGLIGSEFNDSIETWETNNPGEELTPQRMAIMGAADTFKVALERIPFAAALKGTTGVSQLKKLVTEMVKDVPKSYKIDFGKEIAKRLTVVAGNIVEESAQEGVQHAIDYYNREYGTKNDKGFNTDELFKSMIAGGAAGGAIGGAKNAPGIVKDAVVGNYHRIENNKVIKSREDMSPSEIEFQDASFETDLAQAKENIDMSEAQLSEINSVNSLVDLNDTADRDLKDMASTELSNYLSDAIKKDDKIARLLADNNQNADIRKILDPEGKIEGDLDIKSARSLINSASPTTLGALAQELDGFSNALSDSKSPKVQEKLIKSLKKKIESVQAEAYVSQALSEKNQKLFNKGKAPEARTDETVVDTQTKNLKKVDKRTLANLFGVGKSIKTARKELSAYNTTALKDALANPNARDSTKGIIKKILEDRAQSKNILGFKDGSLEMLKTKKSGVKLMAQALNKKAPKLAAAALKEMLKKSSIIDTTEARDDMIEQINALVKDGALTATHGEIMRRRVTRMSKDAVSVKEFKKEVTTTGEDVDPEIEITDKPSDPLDESELVEAEVIEAEEYAEDEDGFSAVDEQYENQEYADAEVLQLTTLEAQKIADSGIIC